MMVQSSRDPPGSFTCKNLSKMHEQDKLVLGPT